MLDLLFEVCWLSQLLYVALVSTVQHNLVAHL